MQTFYFKQYTGKTLIIYIEKNYIYIIVYIYWKSLSFPSVPVPSGLNSYLNSVPKKLRWAVGQQGGYLGVEAWTRIPVTLTYQFFPLFWKLFLITDFYQVAYGYVFFNLPSIFHTNLHNQGTYQGSYRSRFFDLKFTIWILLNWIFQQLSAQSLPQ